MKRREFLRTASGATAIGGAVNAAGTAAAQSAKTVKVGPGGTLVFDPETVYVKQGGTVTWSWESDNHNIVAGEIPDGATWEGTKGPPSKTYNTGHTYEHTFETKGTYQYWCEPHKQLGMTGTVIVNDTGNPPSGGGGGGDVDPKHMGVPLQAHFVGIATLLSIVVSLVFTFFLLKYGESRHASGGN